MSLGPLGRTLLSKALVGKHFLLSYCCNFQTQEKEPQRVMHSP
jgi:hypothetical protein